MHTLVADDYFDDGNYVSRFQAFIRLVGIFKIHPSTSLEMNDSPMSPERTSPLWFRITHCLKGYIP